MNVIVCFEIIFFTSSQPLEIPSISKNQHLFKDLGTSHIIIMVKLGLKHLVPNLCWFLMKDEEGEGNSIEVGGHSVEGAESLPISCGCWEVLS